MSFSYLFRRKKSPEAIQIEIETTRENYLKDLDKLRAKYAATFLALRDEYKSACISE